MRHHTFFEMLGNFSFGDYFKADAIAFAWTLLTDVWKMPPDRLVVSIFKGENGIPRDDEAYDIWRTVRPGRSHRRARRRRQLLADGRHRARAAAARRSTTSAAAAGQRPARSRSGTTCSWSSSAAPTARSTPLPAPSIDTGMGLERITAVLQGKQSNYDTDLFTPLLDRDRRAGRHRATATTTRARRLDARRRRSHPRDDVPDRRRRHPVERMARLRAAQDHAARDAPRQAPGPDRAVPAPLVDVLDREMGDAYPELRAEPRDDRADDPRRGEALRRGADRRAAPPRGRARQGARHASSASCPATRRSGSTTRSACRSTSSRTRQRRRA